MSIAFPLSNNSLRWLYVDFNSYFASVEQQLNPHLRGKPVAVVPVMSDSTCAIAASYEAKAFGVKTGTPVHEAKQKCPGLVCVEARHEHYVDYHHRLIAEIENHIPVTQVCSIDEMACKLMDNENAPEVARSIASRIKRGIAGNVGEFVKCSIGIAPNKYLAKVATDMRKPDGLTLLEAKDIPHGLHGLKLRDLPGIGHNMEYHIRMKGIGDLPALLALSPRQMRQLWGSVWGERMWYYLRGVDLPDLETHRSTVGHSHVMAPEFRHPDEARHVARRLAQKAASRMRRLGYYARTLSFSTRLEHGPRWFGEARCEAAQDSETFLLLLEQLWKEMLHDTRGARMKKVSVTLHHLVLAEEARRPRLFDMLPPVLVRRRMRAERLSHALDKLNQRYGRNTVLYGPLPGRAEHFSGTKVAFTRIPDVEEFRD